jgi:hypothetical protein
MRERNQAAWTVMALGAVVGSAVAYLMFTEGGRRIRARIEPRVGDALRELDRWGATDHLKRLVLGGRDVWAQADRGGSDR